MDRKAGRPVRRNPCAALKDSDLSRDEVVSARSFQGLPKLPHAFPGTVTVALFASAAEASTGMVIARSCFFVALLQCDFR